jgi:aminomethyltransferase
MAQKTPLYQAHIDQGARMVEFAGWEMPIQYAGLKEEHLHVRSKMGAFDVSHMGEISVKGPKALETLEWLTTNHVAKLGPGQAQYSLFPNEQGGLGG